MSKPYREHTDKKSNLLTISKEAVSSTYAPVCWVLMGGVLLGISQLHPALTVFSFVAIIPLILVLFGGYFAKRRSIILVLMAFYLPYTILSCFWLFDLGNSNAVVIILLHTLLMVVALFPIYLRHGKKSPLLVCAAVLVAWLGVETLQLHWAFAYPLQSLGVNLLDFPSWVQWYAWTGATSGTAWVLSVNIGLAIYIKSIRDSKYSFWWGPVTATVLILPIGISYLKLAQADFAVKLLSESVSVTVLHPNLDCYGERTSYSTMETAEYYANMMRSTVKAESPDLLLLPENVLLSSGWLTKPSRINLNPSYQVLQEVLAKNTSLKVLVGAVVYEEVSGGMAQHPLVSYNLEDNFYYRTYNAIVELGSESAEILRTKQYLVPFEETIPLAETLGNTLKNVGKQVGKTGNGFSKLNDGRNSLKVAGNNILSLICYESLFGAATARIVADKHINLITIHLNEGWYDNQRGARLFEKHAQARAIENYKPVVRSSNRGSSGFISAIGKISQSTYTKNKQLALNEKIRGNKTITFYSKFFAQVSGWFWLCIFTAAYVGLYFVTEEKK